MKLSELLNVCGNNWRFIKVYLNLDDENRDFDKNKPDFIYSNKKFIRPYFLNASVGCWHVDRKNNDLEVLLLI